MFEVVLLSVRHLPRLVDKELAVGPLFCQHGPVGRGGKRDGGAIVVNVTSQDKLPRILEGP